MTTTDEQMQLIQERTYERDGKTFVLKLLRTNTGLSVVALLDGQPVSPSYDVSFGTHTDYFMQHQQSFTDNLFGIAQSDIDRELYFRA